MVIRRPSPRRIENGSTSKIGAVRRETRSDAFRKIGLNRTTPEGVLRAERFDDGTYFITTCLLMNNAPPAP